MRKRLGRTKGRMNTPLQLMPELAYSHANEV
jgi:hypothetical protein